MKPICTVTAPETYVNAFQWHEYFGLRVRVTQIPQCLYRLAATDVNSVVAYFCEVERYYCKALRAPEPEEKEREDYLRILIAAVYLRSLFENEDRATPDGPQLG